MTYTLSFLLAMLTPVAMFVVGLIWTVFPPADRSRRFASRTALAQKSDAAWRFAHKKISSLWLRIGVLAGGITVAIFRIFPDAYASYVLWVICGEMVLLCLSSFLVDGTMKLHFDEQGNPIEKK